MIRRQLLVFLCVGTLTVLLDYVVYRGIAWTGAVATDVAKAAGFLAGTVFAYFANRHWTFAGAEPARGSPWRFAVLYVCTLATNVGVNEFLLDSLGRVGFTIQLAFLVATAVSATLNFAGMKWFVFRTVTVSGPA